MTLATQFRVTDEVGTYLCAVLAPAHSVTNDLSWAEEKSAVALANFVPCILIEVARIARLGAHHLMGWPDSSSLQEEEEEGDEQEEEKQDE